MPREFPKMRTWEEIQEAHDTLAQVALVPDLSEKIIAPQDRELVKSVLDVLCWVLHHDHNTDFATNLREIEDAFTRLGYIKVERNEEFPV